MQKKLLIYADSYIDKVDEKKSFLREDGFTVYTIHEDDVTDFVKQLGKVEEFYFTENVSVKNQNIFSQAYNAQKMS